MKIANWVLLAVTAATPEIGVAQEFYGGISATGIYSSSDRLVDDEVIDSSTLLGRGYAGARWNRTGNMSRLQATSSYYGYFDREDRWSNAIEAEQRFRLSDTTSIGFEASAASNISTLEVRSADQMAGTARLILEPGDHRLTLAAAIRRRNYDGSPASSWAPLIEADYRYRIGRYNYLDAEIRHESTDSDDPLLEYNRFAAGAFYTHPLGGDTRVRVGAAGRWWKWDSRLTPLGTRQRDRVLVPQARLTHPVSEMVDLEVDYRYFVRRSNNDLLDRDGHRLAATARLQF